MSTPEPTSNEFFKLKVLQAAEHLTKAIQAAHRGPWVAYPQDDSVHITRPYCSSSPTCDSDCGIDVVRVGYEGCEEDILSIDDAFYIAQMNPRIASWLVLMLESYAAEMDMEVSQSHPMTMYWVRQLVHEINGETDPDEVPQHIESKYHLTPSQTSDHNPNQPTTPDITYNPQPYANGGLIPSVQPIDANKITFTPLKAASEIADSLQPLPTTSNTYVYHYTWKDGHIQ